mmetsp:Transcript_16904/g.43141  ORF Transcript_16904/g.43141 Transcript_16904/m.43141 type:complete len:392 (-) Transcript_16904:86-1261(-)
MPLLGLKGSGRKGSEAAVELPPPCLPEDTACASPKKNSNPKGRQSELQAAAPPPGAVFGVPFHPNCTELPVVVRKCVDYLDSDEHLVEEGIFRLSASQEAVNSLRARFDAGEDVDLTGQETAVVANTLKLFLRELPVPLMTHEYYECFLMAYSSRTEDKQRAQALRHVLGLMPPANRTVLTAFIAFLTRVAAHSERNKMTPSNLGIVFGPALLAPAVEGDIQSMAADNVVTTATVQLMIAEYAAIFGEAEKPMALDGAVPLEQQGQQAKEAQQQDVPPQETPQPDEHRPAGDLPNLVGSQEAAVARFESAHQTKEDKMAARLSSSHKYAAPTAVQAMSQRLQQTGITDITEAALMEPAELDTKLATFPIGLRNSLRDEISRLRLGLGVNSG